MKATWNRANIELFGAKKEAGPNTASVYLDYDLRSWTFGLRFENDPSWYGLHLDFGPVSLSFIYWRTYVVSLGD